MKTESMAKNRTFRRSYPEVKNEADHFALLQTIAEDERMIALQTIIYTAIGWNYTDFVIDDTLQSNPRFSHLLNVEVKDMARRYSFLETVAQNADKLQTFSTMGPNCSYLLQIQSAVLQELSLTDIWYERLDEPDDEEFWAFPMTSALPSSFVQWIAQQSPFRNSL